MGFIFERGFGPKRVNLGLVHYMLMDILVLLFVYLSVSQFTCPFFCDQGKDAEGKIFASDK